MDGHTVAGEGRGGDKPERVKGRLLLSWGIFVLVIMGNTGQANQAQMNETLYH